MTGSVGDEGDQIHILVLLAPQQTVDSLNQYLDDIDILPLVEAADVIGLASLSLMEDKIDGTCMILDIEPVAHVLTLTIDRQRLTVADIIDKERYQFLRELIRTVVVRAVGHNYRHTIGVVEGTHEMITRRLGGRLRRMRIVFRGFQEELLTVRQMVLR